MTFEYLKEKIITLILSEWTFADHFIRYTCRIKRYTKKSAVPANFIIDMHWYVLHTHTLIYIEKRKGSNSCRSDKVTVQWEQLHSRLHSEHLALRPNKLITRVTHAVGRGLHDLIQTAGHFDAAFHWFVRAKLITPVNSWTA